MGVLDAEYFVYLKYTWLDAGLVCGTDLALGSKPLEVSL